MKSICVGIDLGTSNSCVAQYFEHAATNPDVHKYNGIDIIVPSCVLFKDGSCIVGDYAKEHMTEYPDKAFYGTKRIIGRLYDKIRDDIPFFNYVIEKDGRYPVMPLKTETKEYKLTPDHIAALIIKKICENTKTQKAVITVPANFNDYQRRSTIDAGKIAGLDVLNVISEPTAAAIYYVYKNKMKDADKKILVFDIGGGTLDVSLVHVKGYEFTILATSGDTHIGGMDVDKEIIELIAKRFKNKHHDINIYADEHKRDRAKIIKLAEEAKIALSSTLNHEIYITVGGEQEAVNLTRSYIESIYKRVFSDIGKPIDEVLKLTNLKEKDIDDLIMIGGTTRAPIIKKLIEDKIGIKASDVDPDQSVALGAAIYGAVLCGKKIDVFDHTLNIRDVTPMDISIELKGNTLSQLIKKNVVRPAHSKWERYSASPGQNKISLKIFEGDDHRPSNCYKVGEFIYDVESSNIDKSIFVRVDVTDDKISLYGVVDKPDDNKELPQPLKVEERKDAHSLDEINSIKDDIQELLGVKSGDTPAVQLLNKINTLIRKHKKPKGKNEKYEAAKNKALEIKKWAKKHQDATAEEADEKFKEAEAAYEIIEDKNTVIKKEEIKKKEKLNGRGNGIELVE